MQATSIGDALFTKTQQRVLGLLYGRPDKSFYTNEIVRWADMGRGTIRRELERMVSAGLLSVSREGNQQHYRANPDSPVYPELLGIVRKTFGITDVMRKSLEPLISGVEFSFIYGSIAKGGETAKSDIDLLVVSDSLSYGDLINEFNQAEKLTGRTINPSIFTIKQIKKKLKEKNAFITRIMKLPKLWVKGSDNDIKQFR